MYYCNYNVAYHTLQSHADVLTIYDRMSFIRCARGFILKESFLHIELKELNQLSLVTKKGRLVWNVKMTLMGKMTNVVWSTVLCQ